MNKITKLLTCLLLAINISTINLIALAKTNKISIPRNLKVPVVFKYAISSEELQKGSKIRFSVAENVYIEKKLLFKKDSDGIAYVDSAKKRRIFGRGGKIKIEHGNIRDIYGNMHTLKLSLVFKGRNRKSAVLVPLVAAGAATLIFPVAAVVGFAANSTAPLIGAAAATGGPALTAFSKGEEAHVSPARIIYAKHVSPSYIKTPR